MNFRILPALKLCFISLLFTGCAAFFPPTSFNLSHSPQSVQKYRGIFHVHTVFSGDSKSTLAEVSKTAKKSNLDFVVITDHNTLEGKTQVSEKFSLGNPLLIFGVELTTELGHMILMNIPEMPPSNLNAEEAAGWAQQKGGSVFLAHPMSLRTPWKDWEIENFDGFEAYNFAHDFYLENKFKILTKLSFLFPKTFLRSFQKNPNQALKHWDALLQTRKVSMTGAVDSHLKFKELGVSFVGLPLQFQSVTLYVLSKNRTEKSIVDAIKQGHSYVAREAYGTADNFSFTISDQVKIYFPGESVSYSANLFLEVELPKKSMLRIIHDGKVILEKTVKSEQLALSEPGYYRVEVYQGKDLWILTNPIYIGR